MTPTLWNANVSKWSRRILLVPVALAVILTRTRRILLVPVALAVILTYKALALAILTLLTPGVSTLAVVILP